MRTMVEGRKRTAAGLWAALLLAPLAWTCLYPAAADSGATDRGSPESILRQKYPEPQLGPPEPALPPLGGALVRTRGCMECHRLQEQGARAGVDLSRIGWRLSAIAIERRLLQPLEADPEATMPRPDLTRDEVVAIAGYLSRLR